VRFLFQGQLKDAEFSAQRGELGSRRLMCAEQS
jgi:hypothetical protein